ncbi:hypothetical protein [Burkholderia phage BCSR5]|nr:hypothetical protein [Burkholderia phage BCSR5]
MAAEFFPFPAEKIAAMEAHAAKHDPNAPSKYAQMMQKKQRMVGDDQPVMQPVDSSSTGPIHAAPQHEAPRGFVPPTTNQQPAAQPPLGTTQPHQPAQGFVDRSQPLGPQLEAAVMGNGVKALGIKPTLADGSPNPEHPMYATMMAQRGQHPNQVQRQQAVPQQTAAAQAVQSTVPVAPPAFSGPVTDGEGISVALPSRFFFYDFNDLYVRSPKGRNLAKIALAHEQRSLQPMVEVMADLTYSTSGGVQFIGQDGIMRPVAPAYLLTLPDFYFMLYYIRQHYYTKSQYIHRTTCTNPRHIAAVEAGQMKEESLLISELITKSTLDLKELETLPDVDWSLSAEGWQVQPARMIDSLDYLECKKSGDSEFDFLAQLASSIGRTDGVYATIEERVEALGDFEIEDIEKVKHFESVSTNYGVQERIRVRCKECGASRETELSLDAHSFLAFEFES